MRLRTYRERVGELAREPAGLITGPLAVGLEVALDSEAELMRFGDLDNYLTPMAVALKALAPVSFRGVKRVGGESTLTLAEARSAPGHSAEGGWAGVEVRTTASATATAWKEPVAAQVGRHQSADRRGPLEVEVSFFVSPQCNWTTLWKPALDSLGVSWETTPTGAGTRGTPASCASGSTASSSPISATTSGCSCRGGKRDRVASA